MIFSEKKIATDIRQEAQVLNLHMGAVEAIIDKVTARVGAWARERSAITKEDLERVTARELKKYNADLAYLYKNRGKII